MSQLQPQTISGGLACADETVTPNPFADIGRSQYFIKDILTYLHKVNVGFSILDCVLHSTKKQSMDLSLNLKIQIFCVANKD